MDTDGELLAPVEFVFRLCLLHQFLHLHRPSRASLTMCTSCEGFVVYPRIGVLWFLWFVFRKDIQ